MDLALNNLQKLRGHKTQQTNQKPSRNDMFFLVPWFGLVWFGLVSLFNGISTFVGYLMPKVFSKKNNSCTI